MNAKIKDITRVVSYAVTDADPMRLEYGQTMFCPDTVSVTVRGGAWRKAQVSGPRIKADGTLSGSRHENTFWPSSLDVPGWVHRLAVRAETER